MTTIGLLGGMSWESTAAHHRQALEQVRARLVDLPVDAAVEAALGGDEDRPG